MSGAKRYQIKYLDSVVKNDIPELFITAKELIKKAVEERLMVDPIGFGRPLRYSLKGHRRLRVRDYRIVYRIEPKEHQVIIVAINIAKMSMRTIESSYSRNRNTVFP